MPGRTPAARPHAPVRTRLRLADAGPFARGTVAAVVAVATLVIAGHACPARAASAVPEPVARHVQP
ncbi:hypothetical protein AB0H51_04415 [Streptomyces griseoluteus]|uniref:hypothetical protein n=1 Tax=Streptomyces griseoluteus TaxID=29306 RepID=UPI0033DCBF66